MFSKLILCFSLVSMAASSVWDAAPKHTEVKHATPPKPQIVQLHAPTPKPPREEVVPLVVQKPEVYEVTATGYTANYESTGKHPGHPEYGITFSGVKVRRAMYSTIAADLSVFPLGTVLHIPDYGYGVVADTGSAIKGRKIDLYFETVADVYNEWGKRDVPVEVVHWGDGKVSERDLARLNRSSNPASNELAMR